MLREALLRHEREAIGTRARRCLRLWRVAHPAASSRRRDIERAL